MEAQSGTLIAVWAHAASHVKSSAQLLVEVLISRIISVASFKPLL